MQKQSSLFLKLFAFIIFMKKVIKQNGQIISAPTRLTINLTGADILAFYQVFNKINFKKTTVLPCLFEHSNTVGIF